MIHTHNPPSSKRWLALAAGLLFVQPAAAGLVAEATSKNERSGEVQSLIIEADDTDIARMNFPHERGNNYMLLRDGNLYMVTDQQGEPMVMDMADFHAMTQRMGAGGAPDMAADDMTAVKRLTDTGRNEAVAGIQGRVYELVWLDGRGEQRTDELVLSSDERARAFTEVWSNIIRQMDTAFDKPGDGSRQLKESLDSEGMGFLRMGDRFRLTALRQDAFPSGHFELPGPVMDMEAFLSGGMAPRGGGAPAPTADTGEDSYGDIFGEQGERLQERASERAERRTQQQTDSAVDEAVDKVMDSLFGN